MNGNGNPTEHVEETSVPDGVNAELEALRREVEEHRDRHLRAVAELEWVAERGARVVYLSTAPASGFGGRRSIAQPEFDPFWTLMEDTGIVAGFHQVVNRRYPVDVSELDGTGETGGYFVPPGFGLAFDKAAIEKYAVA